jgi:5-methylthioadenosine/S-adenosylhomocysteine deaminase
VPDATAPAVPHAAVAVDPSGQIAYAGPAAGLPARMRGWPVTDLGPCLLMPGMVNGHAHTFQSLLRGPGDDLDFDAWVGRVLYPATAAMTEADLETGALLAFADMLRAGITSVAEFFYVTDQGLDTSRVVLRAARQAGIRLVFGRCLYDANPAAPARYREAAAEAADRIRALARECAGDPLVRVVPAPHSPHAASPEAIQVGAALAEELDSVWTMHLAERRDEVAALRRAGYASPAAFLDRLGVLGPRAVLVHGVHLPDGDAVRIAAAGAAVIHNPGANLMLGDGVAPLLRWRAFGLRLGLGTDGGCTNNRLSILDEMRLAALLAKGLAEDGAALSAAAAFALGTADGAAALGLSTGRLVAGMPADIAALDLTDPALLPLSEPPVGSVVYAASPRAVRHVFVAGRQVVAEGRLTSLDGEALRARVEASHRRLRAAWRGATGPA